MDSASGKPVILFSFGIIGVIAYTVLNKMGIKIQMICDNDIKKRGFVYLNTEVNDASALNGVEHDTLVIIASKYFSSISQQLSDIGFHNVIDCSSVFAQFELDISEIDTSIKNIIPWFPETTEDMFQQVDLYMSDLFNNRYPHSLIIRNVELVVTEKCSLKCKDCSNLMQYYKNAVDADFDKLCLSVMNLSKSADNIREFRILGGEPFLYKPLSKLLDFLAHYKAKIVIFTNGTIIPKEEVILKIKKCSATVVISDYGSVSKKAAALAEILTENNVTFISNKPKHWQDCAGFVYDENSNIDDITEKFKNCCVKDALTILHGELFRCPFSAHAKNLRAFYVSSKDFLSLNTVIDRNLLRDFYLSSFPLHSCKFCSGRQFDSGTVIPAIQTSVPLEYVEVNE